MVINEHIIWLVYFTVCMRKINNVFAGKHIGMPKIGAGLAGGNWNRIEHMADKTKTKSTEVDSTRIPKAAKMERASEILKNQLDNYVYMDMAEEKCGELIDRDGDFIPLDSDGNSFTYEDNLTDEERKHNGEVFAYSAELEKKEWEEFCSIIKDKKTGLKNWWD